MPSPPDVTPFTDDKVRFYFMSFVCKLLNCVCYALLFKHLRQLHIIRMKVFFMCYTAAAFTFCINVLTFGYIRLEKGLPAIFLGYTCRYSVLGSVVIRFCEVIAG